MSKDTEIYLDSGKRRVRTTSDNIEDFAYKSGVAVGDMVKVASDGTLSLASGSDVPVGAVFETTAGSSTRVITQGVIESVLSGATPGTLYYLSSSGSSGNTISYSATSNTKVGFAKSASDLFVKVTTTSFNSILTFGSTDATPSVAAGNLFKTGGMVQFTNFDDGVAGQIITIIVAHSCMFDVTDTNLKGGSTDITCASGDVTTWVFDGTYWYLMNFMDQSANLSAGH